MREFIAASVQISIEPNAFKRNLEKVCAWYEVAARERHAELVVFPESITSGFHPGPNAEALYRLIPSDLERFFRPVRQLAAATRSCCVLPSYERGRRAGQVFNSAFLFTPDGKVAGCYRKTHPFPEERAGAGGWTTPGTRIPVFATPLGMIGIIICYDGDFPELSRALAVQGAELIARPAAFRRNYEIWELTNRMRAYENNVFVIAANAVGSDAGGNHYFGHSMIVDPTATKLALARSDDEIVYARVSARILTRGTAGNRSPVLVNHLADRNLPCYQPHLMRALHK